MLIEAKPHGLWIPAAVYAELDSVQERRNVFFSLVLIFNYYFFFNAAKAAAIAVCGAVD